MIGEHELGRTTVLIVEDHAAVRNSLRDWLNCAIPEVAVITVGSAEEALAYVSKGRVDIVLMDIGLPGMNGIEGTRAIRERVSGAAVVICSVMDDLVHVAEAHDAGAVAFVSKRRMRQDLLPALKAVLATRQDPAGPTVVGMR